MKRKRKVEKHRHDGPCFMECPSCGTQQGDMGHHVKCDECGFGPMPTGEENCVVANKPAAGRGKEGV